MHDQAKTRSCKVMVDLSNSKIATELHSLKGTKKGTCKVLHLPYDPDTDVTILAIPGTILAISGTILAIPGTILAIPGTILAISGTILAISGAQQCLAAR